MARYLYRSTDPETGRELVHVPLAPTRKETAEAREAGLTETPINRFAKLYAEDWEALKAGGFAALSWYHHVTRRGRGSVSAVGGYTFHPEPIAPLILRQPGAWVRYRNGDVFDLRRDNLAAWFPMPGTGGSKAPRSAAIRPREGKRPWRASREQRRRAYLRQKQQRQHQLPAEKAMQQKAA
jgi:hypothetical protein